MEESNAAQFTRLLAEAQAEMKNPPKSKKGQKGNQTYMYATLDSVLEIVRPPLNGRGIFLWQESESANGGMLLHTKVAFADCVRTLDVKPYEYRADPKDFGAAESYARRYSLLAAFGLAGEDDNDGTVSARASKPPANQKPDRRKAMLAKIAKLKMECMQNGVREEGINDYMRATFGTEDMESMGDKAIEGLGKYLKQMAEDSAAVKERSDVD